MNDIKLAAEMLVARHGTLRAAARAVNMDHAYLWRLLNGRKTNPGDDVLRKLGLVRRVTYSKPNNGARR